MAQIISSFNYQLLYTGSMAEAVWLDDTERAAWLTLTRGTGLLLDELERELLVDHGLTLGDYGILAALSHAGCAGLRMSELADGALVSRSRLTHRVNRLEEEGLVQRVACETDRRGAFALLTEAGHRRLAAAAPTHLAGLRTYFVQRLDRDELEALTAMLTKVLAGLGETLPVYPPGLGPPPPTADATGVRAC